MIFARFNKALSGGIVFRVLAFVALLVLAPAQSALAQLQSGSQEVSSTGFAPSTEFVENNGLAVRVLFVGKNASQKTLTLSAELKNTSSENLWLAIIGPKPVAVDTSGNSYQLQSLNGLAQCQNLDNRSIAYCMSNYAGYLPGDAFASLQSGASSIATMTFTATDIPDSGFMSLSINVAVGTGQKPENTTGKPRDVANIAISFPLITLEDK